MRCSASGSGSMVSTTGYMDVLEQLALFKGVIGDSISDILSDFNQLSFIFQLVKKRSGATGYPCLVPKSLCEPSNPPELWGKHTQANVQVRRGNANKKFNQN